MKSDEISQLTVAAFKQGYSEGSKRASKRLQMSMRAAHKLEHEIMETTIRDELGEAAWLLVKEALTARRAAMSSDVLATLGGVMEKMGLGDEVSKLVKLYEAETPDGRARATVFGIDLENGRAVDFGGGLGEQRNGEAEPNEEEVPVS